MFSFIIQRKQLFLIFSYWDHYSFTSSCRCGSFEGFVISWRCTLSMLVTPRSQYISIPGAARWAQKLFHPFNTHGKVVVSKYKFPDRVIRKSIRSQYFPLPRLFRLLLLQHFKLVQVFLGGCGVVVVVDHVASFYSQLSLYYTFPPYTRLVFRGLWMYLLLPLLLRRSVRRSALENVIRLRSRCRSPKRKERKKRGGRGKAVGASFLIVRRQSVCRFEAAREEILSILFTNLLRASQLSTLSLTLERGSKPISYGREMYSKMVGILFDTYDMFTLFINR